MEQGNRYMFNALNNLKRIAAIALISTLASCGGGGSATGGSTDFSVIPNKFTLDFADGNTTCALDPGSALPEVRVTIVGGTPPYRIVNSFPQLIRVSQTTLTEKNPTFSVYALGGCGSDLNLLILDNLSRSINFTATFTAGAASTVTP